MTDRGVAEITSSSPVSGRSSARKATSACGSGSFSSGAGEASGMFPLDGTDYDRRMLDIFDGLPEARRMPLKIWDVLPRPLAAVFDFEQRRDHLVDMAPVLRQEKFAAGVIIILFHNGIDSRRPSRSRNIVPGSLASSYPHRPSDILS